MDRFRDQDYPNLFSDYIEIDSSADPETGMLYCSVDFFTQYFNTVTADQSASDAYGFLKDVQTYENIVYPGVSEGTRFPNFGKILNEETLRFRDNVNNDPDSQCLRGSIAQFDQYEILGDDDFLDFFDPFALTRDVTVFFEVNPYSAKVCLTSDLDICLSPIERCELLLTTETNF